MLANVILPALVLFRRRLASSGPPSPGLDIFEAELVSRLKGDEALRPIIGDRVYPLAIPQQRQGQPSLLPCLVYAITTNSRARNLQGPAGIAVATVLFDARAASYGDVKRIQEALRELDGFSGTLAEDVTVLHTWYDDQGDEYEWPSTAGASPGTFHLTLKFRFKYREPTNLDLIP